MAQNCPAANQSSSKGNHRVRALTRAANIVKPAARNALSRQSSGGCQTQWASMMPSENPPAASNMGAVVNDRRCRRCLYRVARRGAG